MQRIFCRRKRLCRWNDRHQDKPETAESFAEKGREFQAGGDQVDIKNVLSSLRGRQQERAERTNVFEENRHQTVAEKRSF